MHFFQATPAFLGNIIVIAPYINLIQKKYTIINAILNILNKGIDLSLRLAVVMVILCINDLQSQDIKLASFDNKTLDMSTSLSSLNHLCEAISEKNFKHLEKLTTKEGYDHLVNEIGLYGLGVDILFWAEAISNGRILASEKIESETEMTLLQNHSEYQILCVNSFSEQDLMLIARITFVKIKGKWKFLAFSEG